MKSQHNSEKTTLKDEFNMRDLKNALAPFEDALIANLPTKDEVLKRAQHRIMKKNIRISGVFVFIAALTGLFYFDPVYHTEIYTTQKGEHKKVQLFDQSQIHLNTASKVSVAYHLRSKKIELLQGEATFSVNHFTQQWMRPLERRFFVRSGQMLIEDIGTVFNVRQYSPSYSDVTVLQGQVRVSQLNHMTGKVFDLYRGEGAELNHQQLLKLSLVDVDEKTTWQKNKIQFKDIPLSAMVTELQRYHHLKVEFHDVASQNNKVSGYFSLDNTQQIFQVLAEVAHVQVSQDRSGTWHIRANES